MDNLKFVENARKYIGVKWVNGGRTKYGLDCGGLLKLSLEGLYDCDDYNGYGNDHHNIPILNIIGTHFEPVNSVRAGDIIVMKLPRMNAPSHIAIVGETDEYLTIIHCTRIKGVIEHIYSDKWKKYQYKVFRPFE